MFPRSNKFVFRAKTTFPMLPSSDVYTHTYLHQRVLDYCINTRARHVQVVFAIRIARFSSFPLFNPVRKVAFISLNSISGHVLDRLFVLFVVCRNSRVENNGERPRRDRFDFEEEISFR